MLGANLPAQARNTLHVLDLDGHFSLSQRSALHVHSWAHQHPAMRQRHAFTPVLHQTSSLLPAPHVMGTQDSNFNVHPFHPATQTSFSSTTGGRWAALHVRIAWKIYYNKKFKKTPQKPNSVSATLTPECPPGTGLPDSETRQVSDQPSSTHANSDFPCGASGVRSELTTTAHRFSRLPPSDLRGSSLALCHNLPTTQREEVTHHRPEKHAVHPVATVEGSPLRDKPRDQSASAQLQVRRSGSLSRKRQLERDTFIQAKRLKKEPLDDTLDTAKTFHTEPSWFSMSHAHPSSLTTSVHHRSLGHLSALYPNGSTALGGTPSCAGREISPYQTAPWELLWNRREHLHSRHSALRENAVRPAEAFGGFFVPPLYFHPALGVQEPPYLSGREFLRAHPENCHPHPSRSHLPHPGFLTTSC